MARKMVTRLKKADGKAAGGATPARPRRRITCAFCNGEGKDPFGIPSILSSCQVCKGSGKVWVYPPTMKCGFCAGSGVFQDKRITCTVCGGKGVVPKPTNAKTCPVCLGTGMTPYGLPDHTCRGKGVIAG